MRLQRVTVPIALLLIVSVLSVGGGGATAVAASGSDCSYPATFTDATGTEVTVEEEPESVVTLNPSAAQTMWEIGAKDKVVGVSKYAAYLEGASEKTNISGPGRTTVVVEKVVALQPDLVLAPNTISNGTVQQLRDNGLTVYRFGFAGSLADIRAKTLLTGELVGECEGAQETADWMDEQTSIIEETVEGEQSVRALYTFSGGYTAGEGTFLHRAIVAAGGTNVAAEAGIEGYRPISEETIAEQDPEWIVRNTYSPEVPKTDAYNATTAVQEGNVVVVNTNLINQPAPRIVYPILKMVKAFHPEAYDETLRTPTPSATPSPTDAPATTEPPTVTDAAEATATPTETSSSSPGMGVLVALVALAGAALAVTRR
jgi:iron complex transport system substrate-binding protein